VVELAKPLSWASPSGGMVDVFLACDIAAEREAWQAQHKKDQQNLVNCVEDLEEVQAALAKAEAALDGEHRRADAAVSALDKAEEIIDHVQTRYEGQVARGNMLEKMREHQFQRADKAEAKCQNCPLKLLNPSERETVLQAALAKAEARVRELEAALYKKGKWNPEIDEVERILRNAIDKSLPKEARLKK